MSSITTPSPPSPPFYIGKGLSGAGGTLSLFGYDIPNNLSSQLSGIVGALPWSIVNAETDFDVSPFGENNEVVLLLYKGTGLHVTARVDCTFNWYRDHDDELIFSYSTYAAAPPSGKYYGSMTFVAWIGWLSDYYVAQWGNDEIIENGNYHCEVTLTGGLSISRDINFVVRNMPARTILSNEDTTSFDYTVKISNHFNDDNYIRVGVCNTNFTDGQSTAPSGIVAYKSAPTTGISCVVEGTVTGQSPGHTYTLYGFAQAANGNYYRAGSDTITTDSIYWNWTYAKTAGANFKLTGTEWLEFYDYIDNARDIANLATYSFTRTPSYFADGQPFYYWMMRQAATAIDDINGDVDNSLKVVNSGDPIYAWYFNNLRVALNNAL